MVKPFYGSLEQVPELVRLEYVALRYRFNAPPVPPRMWTAVDWINYVTFDNLEVVNGEYALKK